MGEINHQTLQYQEKREELDASTTDNAILVEDLNKQKDLLKTLNADSVKVINDINRERREDSQALKDENEELRTALNAAHQKLEEMSTSIGIDPILAGIASRKTQNLRIQIRIMGGRLFNFEDTNMKTDASNKPDADTAFSFRK